MEAAILNLFPIVIAFLAGALLGMQIRNKTIKLLTEHQLQMSEELRKVTNNYNTIVADLIQSYHMLVQAHDGELTIEEIHEFINKPK